MARVGQSRALRLITEADFMVKVKSLPQLIQRTSEQFTPLKHRRRDAQTHTGSGVAETVSGVCLRHTL